jgi:hypothetical protein
LRNAGLSKGVGRGGSGVGVVVAASAVGGLAGWLASVGTLPDVAAGGCWPQPDSSHTNRTQGKNRRFI